ncbi:MAG: 4-hydroxythreonine-4-phosphate dehydrogenase PdxA [Nitrospirae bacterium]|nr:4-hydroxythreonine-4-phosphate dehydrogenase PdxA [Nitrospirota bacterium]
MKKIAITMGEPGGVGPEVIVRALYHSGIRRRCNPLVIGSAEIMRQAVRLTKLPLEINPVTAPSKSKPERGRIDVIDIKSRFPFKKCAPSKNAGAAVAGYIRRAVGLALSKEVDAVVTAPISKESLKMAGYKWPGHTELLAELTNTKDFAMMFVSDKLKLILCTIHIRLRDVPGRINEKLVRKTINLAERGMRMLGVADPRIAVAGLNPHAGESGILGKEESAAISPAIKKARAGGTHVSGPYPPDVIFHRAYNGEFDMVVCMYHDQGLVPFKMIAFDTGVNVTVGLPVIRTSPDHGTAFDIAWKGKANPASMIEAIKLAARLEL